MKGCSPFPEVRHHSSLWNHLQRLGNASGREDQFQVIHVPPLLAVEIPTEISIHGAEQLAEDAEMVCSWLTTAGKQRRELASSPHGLWLDTQQETGRAQQIHWKSHLLCGSKHETVSRTRK